MVCNHVSVPPKGIKASQRAHVLVTGSGFLVSVPPKGIKASQQKEMNMGKRRGLEFQSPRRGLKPLNVAAVSQALYSVLVSVPPKGIKASQPVLKGEHHVPFAGFSPPEGD